MTSQKCPACHAVNDDNWPVRVNGKVEPGGCQSCWEKECDKSWWAIVQRLNSLLGG